MYLTVQGRGECLELPVSWFCGEFSLELATLKNAFPDATGFKYKPNTSFSNDVYRFIEVSYEDIEEGSFPIPKDRSSYIFHCIYAKAEKNAEQEPIETGQQNDLSRTREARTFKTKMDLTVQGRGECLKLPIFGNWWELKLKLTTLKHAFPDAYGLKYRPNTSCSNDVYSFAEVNVDKFKEEVISIPREPSSYIFHCIYAKAVKDAEQELIETRQRNDLSRTGKGMFIRVTETEFSGERCYLDGINAKQSNDLQAKLLLLQSGQIQIMEADVDNPCLWQVKGITALQLMSFLSEHYEAKILAYSSNVQQVSQWDHQVPRGTTSWTLESLKI